MTHELAHQLSALHIMAQQKFDRLVSCEPYQPNQVLSKCGAERVGTRGS